MVMRRSILACGLLVAVLSRSAAAESCPALLDHAFNPLIGGKPASLCQYSGRVLLVVNTASNCGYTYQYEGLEKLYRKYRERGLAVIGFPANDFGAQEPGSNKQIAEFCQANFGVSFPMFEKLATPIPKNAFYGQLIAASGRAPRWNFHKYLIDKGGRIMSFDSNVEPGGAELGAAIEKALAAR
jgi:glutathione peroxidase